MCAFLCETIQAFHCYFFVLSSARKLSLRPCPLVWTIYTSLTAAFNPLLGRTNDEITRNQPQYRPMGLICGRLIAGSVNCTRICVNLSQAQIETIKVHV